MRTNTASGELHPALKLCKYEHRALPPRAQERCKTALQSHREAKRLLVRWLTGLVGAFGAGCDRLDWGRLRVPLVVVSPTRAFVFT